MKGHCLNKSNKKKRLIKIVLAIVVVLALVFIINRIVKMKFTYNYFNKDVNVGRVEKLEEIKELQKLDNTTNTTNTKNSNEKLNLEDISIPILMYHSISSINPMNNLMVPEKQFEEQMIWLRENNFTPMLMEDVVEAFESGIVPKRPVAITFDDGYYDNYTDAYRILMKNDLKATFFVVGSYVGESSLYMDLNNLKEMLKSGMAVENHTYDHERLYFKTREEQKNSISENIDFLNENLNIDSKFLCYPVGRYNNDTISVDKELGIKAAVTTHNGYATSKNDILKLNRIRMKPMNLESFKNYFKRYIK